LQAFFRFSSEVGLCPFVAVKCCRRCPFVV